MSVKKKFFVLVVLFGLVQSCDAKPKGEAASGHSNAETELVHDSQCLSYKQELLQYIQDGAFIRNRIFETVPSISTSFKYGSTWVRVPLNVADLNRDGLFELIYFIDITAPYHKETKMYLLRSLHEKEAIDLVKGQFKSEFYRPLMGHLATAIEWDARKDIVSGGSRVTLSDSIVEVKQKDDVWRLNLIGIEDRIYLLIEGLNSKTVLLAEFVNGNFEQTIVCSFENLLN